MKICILGIAGTFMTGIACLAKQIGHEVWGIDQGIYAPMSDVLKDHDIRCYEGYHIDSLGSPDLVIIGNAISRGNPCLEYVLDHQISYDSGAEWLYRHVLANRRVIAISGTHGKTTCTHMLVHVLRQAGIECGYLIAGQPNDGMPQTQIGTDWFVIEADEYDTAYFDKQPKFLKYRPHHVLINNVEFDHADIYKDLDSIYLQFERLIRIIPRSGRLYFPQQNQRLRDLSSGYLTPVTTFGHDGEWCVKRCESGWELVQKGQSIGLLEWSIKGDHMRENASAVALMAFDCGVKPEDILAGLATFRGVKRRMQNMGVIDGVKYYDDFAHHPTAITKTLQALKPEQGRQMAIIQPTNFTQRKMIMKSAFIQAAQVAEHAIIISDHLELPQSSNLTVVKTLKEALQIWVSMQSHYQQCVTMSAKSMSSFYQAMRCQQPEEME